MNKRLAMLLLATVLSLTVWAQQQLMTDSQVRRMSNPIRRPILPFLKRLKPRKLANKYCYISASQEDGPRTSIWLRH